MNSSMALSKTRVSNARGSPPGYANAQLPGHDKIANAPSPGLTTWGNASGCPGAGMGTAGIEWCIKRDDSVGWYRTNRSLKPDTYRVKSVTSVNLLIKEEISKDLEWSVHVKYYCFKGVLYSQISLFVHLFNIFFITGCSLWFKENTASKWLPERHNFLQYEWCLKQA